MIDYNKITWGIVANSHDASLAVFKGVHPVWASLSKDFSGVDHDPNLNFTIVSVAKKSFGYPDEVVWYEYPRLKWLRQLWAGQGIPYSDSNVKEYLSRYGLVNKYKLSYTKHHESHAAYGYYSAPAGNTRWAIVVLDSIGEFETFTIWDGLGGRIKRIHSQGYPHSIGLWYSAMTQRIGLQANRDEYIIAEMAKAGDPGRYMKDVNELFDINYPSIKFNVNMHRGFDAWLPDANVRDLAASVQTKFEELIMGISEWLKDVHQYEQVCFMGGCALNKPAIDKVRESNMFQKIHVPKHPGDPGSCLGSVFAKTKHKVDFSDDIWYNN
jgi:carbamoyltransferase